MKKRDFLIGAALMAAISAVAALPAQAASEPPQFDISKVATDPALAARVPERIRGAGKIIIGSDTSYAPWEFISEVDGKTPVGLDVDLAKAIGKTLDIEIDFQSADFKGILPALGPKYDLGISAFSITKARLEAVNLVKYAQGGGLWTIRAGNPTKFDPADPCGRPVAIQSGSFYEGLVTEASTACTAAGKAAIEIIPFATQPEAITRVAAGGADATVGGNATAGYTVAQSEGRLEIVGSMQVLGVNGIAVAKADTELTGLVADTLNKLIEEGTYQAIFALWGNAPGVVEKAEINPVVAK